MVTYALQGPPHAGATLTAVTPGGTVGDLATTGQGIGLLVFNQGTAASMTVVLPVTPTYDGLAVANRVVTVPAGVGPTGAFPGMALIPVPDNVYGVGTTAVQFSTTANVQVALVRIP